MDEASRQADNIIPPTSSATPGVGVTCITTSGTASSVDLWVDSTREYGGYYDRYVTFMAVGADVYILFSSGAVTIDESVGHASTLTSATTTVVPWLLKDGVPQSFRLTKEDHRYVHFKAASGTPKVRFYPSSQPSGRRM